MAAVVPAGTDGWGFRLAASALVLATLSCPRAADAQSPKLEAAYVVLGPRGPVARAVLAQASACPTITIDGTQQPMNVRALPDATFPVLVCELPIPAGVTSASVENLPLPLPKPTLKSIAAFGDTGCRLKAAKATATVAVRTAPNERRALRIIVGLLDHDATAAASITSNTLHPVRYRPPQGSRHAAPRFTQPSTRTPAP